MASARRRLNIKLLLLLTGSVAALAVGVHFLHASQLKRSADSILAQANLSEQQGDAEKARSYLEQYLAYRPNDVEAMIRLGNLLAQDPRFQPRAIQVFEQAIRRDPLNAKLNSTRQRLVELFLESPTPDYSAARTHVEILLADDPHNGQFHYFKGRCEEGLSNFSNAINEYVQAKSTDKNQIDVYVRLADLSRTRERNNAQADKVMDELIANNADSSQAYLARARYRLRYHFPTTAVDEDLAQALRLGPDDPDVLLTAAEVASNKAGALARTKGDPARIKAELETARGYLQHGLELEKQPRRKEFQRSLALIERQAGDPEKAIRLLREAIASTSDQADPHWNIGDTVNLHWTLADTLIQLDKIDEASAEIKELQNLKIVLPEMIQYLEGRVQLARGQFAEAARTLNTAQAALSIRPATRIQAKTALLLLGQCHDRLGNTDQALDAYKRAASTILSIDPDPYDVPARLGMANALTALGRLPEAIEAYREIVPKDPRAGILLARVMIYQHLNQEATNWNDVTLLLDQLEQALPDVAEIKILRAEALAAQGQLSAARNVLQQNLDRQPEQVDYWVALAFLTLREVTNPDSALAILDRAQKQLGDRIELRSARARLLAQKGGPQAAAALADLGNNLDAFSPADQLRLKRELASAYSVIGQLDQAEQLWNEIARLNPNDRNVQLVLFDLALQANRKEEDVNRILNNIKRIEGETGSDWRFGQAALWIREAQKTRPPAAALLAKARNLLDQIIAQRPSWGRALMAVAQIDELEGNQENAIRNYTRAVDLGERNPNAISRLAQLLNAQKRYAEAKEVLQRLKDNRTALSPELQRLEVQVALQNQNYAQAADLAEKSIPADSQNYRDLLLLGQVQMAAGKAEAETTFRHAVAVAPEAPEPRISLIVYLVRTNQKEKAEAALKDAEAALPKDKAPLVLAQGHEVLGHADQAREWYQKALEAQPDDVATLQAVALHQIRIGQFEQADKLLQNLSASSDSAAAHWANRIRAQLVLRGGSKRAAQALKILDHLNPPGQNTNPNRQANDPEDVRTRARILALVPNSERRQEAISLLESLIERRLNTPDDRFLLAQLYEAENNWPKARDQMAKLLETNGQNPAYLAAFIRGLLRQKQVPQAQLNLTKLEQIAPNQPLTIEAKARVLHAQGKNADAVQLLRTFAGDDVARIGLAARLLEELNQYDPAENLLRGLAEKYRGERPEAVAPLAAYLGRRARTKEALDLVDDNAWKALGPEIASNLCVVILYGSQQGNPALPALAEAVAQRIKKAIDENPNLVSLRFDLANARCLQSRFDEAEQIYREVHERNKTSGAPLNNLAWMIALSGKGGGPEEALSLIQQAIDRDGETPDLLDTRAVIQLMRNQPDPAIKDLEDAIRVNATADKYFHLARAYLMANKPNDAKIMLRKAQELGLTPTSLHPLERKAYDKLSADLSRQ